MTSSTDGMAAPAAADGVTLVRETSETSVRVSLALGQGAAGSTAATTLPFLDHMLTAFARYADVRLEVAARGDLAHHISEDVAIVVGAALARVLPPTAARYGERTIPMDDALVQVALDLGGRAYYEGPLPSTRYDHWIRSFAEHAGATVHVRVLRGRDRHHVVEAAFKALGLALREALADGGAGAVFSTKGAVSMREERGAAWAGSPGEPAEEAAC